MAHGSTQLGTRAPTTLVVAAIVNQVAQGIFITMPFTLAVYMVRYYEGSSLDEARVGRLTGLLAAAATGAQTATSYAWGVISDRVGRKPVLMTANVFSALSSVALGLAGSYRAAVAARVLGGLFSSGNSVAIKTVIAEASPDTYAQAVLMSQMVMGWGIGTVLGPLLGGLLANPCTNWSMDLGGACGPVGPLRRWPFMLPCLASAAASCLAFIQNGLLMSETLPSKVVAAAAARGSSGGGVYQRLESDESGGSGAAERAASCVHTGGWVAAEPGAGGAGGSGRAVQLTAVGGASASGREASGAGVRRRSHDASGPASGDGDSDGALHEAWGAGAHAGRGSNEGVALLPAAAARSDGGSELGSVGEAQGREMPWYRMLKVVGAVGGAFVISFTFNVVDELTPILGSAAHGVGGLALPEHRMALPLAFSGVLLVAYNVLLFPRHQAALGQVACVRVGMALAAPAALLVPAASLLAPASFAAMMATLFCALGVKSVSKTMALSSSSLLINLLAPRAQRGAVNGACMTLQSLARCLGPALSGSLWAACVGLRMPGQQFVPFGGAAACALGAVLLYSFVDLSVPPADG